jgi:hypothetical protein
VRRATAAVFLVLIAASACAPRLARLPTGTGAPFPDFASTYTQATEPCRGVRTMVAVLSLSGRAGRTRLRGNIEAGLAAPGQVRLEAPAPFGRPVFILVASKDSATLLLPRDRRVLRDAAPAAIVEALAGVPLDPDQLRGVLAGCGLGSANVTGGRALEGDWVIVDDAAGTTHWLRRLDGAWRLAASAAKGLEVRYEDFSSGRPGVVRLVRPAGESGVAADISIRLSQVDLNVELEASTFEVQIPDDATPMTIEELRRAGPLGETGGQDQP